MYMYIHVLLMWLETSESIAIGTTRTEKYFQVLERSMVSQLETMLHQRTLFHAGSASHAKREDTTCVSFHTTCQLSQHTQCTSTLKPTDSVLLYFRYPTEHIWFSPSVKRFATHILYGHYV